MSKILTRELARHVIGKFGLVPPPNLGKLGITTRDFLLDRRLKIEYDDGSAEFPIWCGVSGCQPSITVLATDLTSDNYHEFCTVFTVDKQVIHGIKHIFSDSDDALFMIWNGEWKPTGLRQKLLLTAGLEQITDLGLGWIPENNYEILYDRLVEIVEM
jgi:hypothetical protein